MNISSETMACAYYRKGSHDHCAVMQIFMQCMFVLLSGVGAGHKSKAAGIHTSQFSRCQSVTSRPSGIVSTTSVALTLVNLHLIVSF